MKQVAGFVILFLLGFLMAAIVEAISQTPVQPFILIGVWATSSFLGYWYLKNWNEP